jgi:two-component system sensor kinase FixL
MALRKLTSSAPALEESDLSRLVLDSLTAEVAVLDKNGTIVEVNDSWTQFAVANGGSPEATGVGVNYLDVCRNVEDNECFLADKAYRGIQQVLDGSQSAFMLEYSCHSDTEQRWFLLSVSRLKSKQSYAVTTHLSITERKLTEQQLVVAERLAAIGEAMQGLSHEGRNALQRAQAGMELLRLHIEEDSEALRLLERIENAQRHLHGLYEEVRSYAAPIVLSRQRVAVNDLVENVWKSFQSQTSTVNFSHLAFEGDLTCSLDPTAMRQVLQMVLDNALAPEAQSREIEVSYLESTCEDAPGITVVVSDDGTGVPETDWETIFRPFYTTKLRGTGLGLAVCKRIVSAHGGRIGLSTPRLGGTSVCITLPRQL